MSVIYIVRTADCLICLAQRTQCTKAASINTDLADIPKQIKFKLIDS